MILQFFGLEWPLYHSYKNPPPAKNKAAWNFEMLKIQNVLS